MDKKQPTLNLNVNRYRALSNSYDDEEFCVHGVGSFGVAPGQGFTIDIALPDYISLDLNRNPGFSRCYLVLKKLTIADYVFTAGELNILHLFYTDHKNQLYEIGYFHSDKKSEIFYLDMPVSDDINTPNTQKLGKISCFSVDNNGTGSQDVFISANFSIIYQIEMLEGETKVEKALGQLGKRVQHWEETLDVYFKIHECDDIQSEES